MNVLITGGAGFIGSNLATEILKMEDLEKLTIIDNLSTGKLENIPKSDKIEFIDGDISDKKILEKSFKDGFDYVFHLAAIASVKKSVIEPAKTHKINFDSTLNLLELIKKQREIKRFVFASSAAVYGNNPNLPCKEENRINPISPYGIDKYSSEQYAICYGNIFNVPFTIFRFFNVFGINQDPSSEYSGVISIFTNAFFLNEEPEITIYGDGSQTRDFIYIKDIITLLKSTMDSSEAEGKVLNACTGSEISIIEIVTLLERITGKKAKITYQNEREGDIKRSFGDNSKIKELKILTNFTGIYDGLKMILNHLKES